MPQRAYETLLEAKRIYDRGESVQAFPRIGAFIHYNLGAVLYARKDYDGAASRNSSAASSSAASTWPCGRWRTCCSAASTRNAATGRRRRTAWTRR